MASCSKENEQLNSRFKLYDSVFNSALAASRIIEGLRGHFSKIMQQLASVIEPRDFSHSKEIARLKSQLIIAHNKFLPLLRSVVALLPATTVDSKNT